MKKFWYLLAKYLTGAPGPDTPATPEVWVSETHTYNSAQDRIEVTWKLHSAAILSDALFVSVYHSSTSTGATENWTWELPAGQTSVQGLYLYPTGNVQGVANLVFGLTAGTGYTIPDTAPRPKEVQVSVGATVPDPEEPTPPGGSTPAEYHNPYPATWSGPITITAGGTYTGNYRSTNQNTPAVMIATTEPVTLLNCNTEANGTGIASNIAGINLTVLNSRHFGGALSGRMRRFVALENFKNLVIENCHFQSSSGIYIAGQYMGNGTENETVRIRYNTARNVDGRTATGSEPAQFFQPNTFRPGSYVTAGGINYYNGVPHMKIQWNEVINAPGLTQVEDNINIYNTRGTSASPILIDDNFIKGAYYWNWKSENFSGSGMIADSPGANEGACTAYVKFRRNVVIGSNNNDYGVAGGTDIELLDNIGLNKGYLDEADALRLGLTPASAQCEYIGYPGNIYVHSNYVAGVTKRITEINHTEGIHGERTFSAGNPRWRNDGDLWNSTYGTITNRTVLPGLITEATEQQAYTDWKARRDAAGVVIGVIVQAGYYNTFEYEEDINSSAFSKETSTAYGITRSNLFAASGTYAARFELRNTDGETYGGVRAEMAFQPMADPDMEFSFSWRLNSADNAVDPNPESIMQFRPVADSGETDGRGTVMALQVENGNLRFYTAYATLATNTAAEGFTFYELGAVPYNQWNTTKIRYRPALDNSGILTLTLNGAQVVNHAGANCYNDGTRPFWKLGLYKWNWPSTTVSTLRVLYVDNVQYKKMPAI